MYRDWHAPRSLKLAMLYAFMLFDIYWLFLLWWHTGGSFSFLENIPFISDVV